MAATLYTGGSPWYVKIYWKTLQFAQLGHLVTWTMKIIITNALYTWYKYFSLLPNDVNCHLDHGDLVRSNWIYPIILVPKWSLTVVARTRGDKSDICLTRDRKSCLYSNMIFWWIITRKSPTHPHRDRGSEGGAGDTGGGFTRAVRLARSQTTSSGGPPRPR